MSTTKYKPGYGPTYRCDRCGKVGLFVFDVTLWNDYDDGGRTNLICKDCAKEFDVPWNPQKPAPGFVE